ncbi:hypothetical protein [Levilactobacillus spicheri]|uniref:Uncharacterized protein n=1 Tax=Levilactobacillus spicheri TaxID=216463 RepID=A0A0F3RVF7_9LACO|nr:hypothetical protein [Levilactobacillus spicheri]KJW13971.1 hypothetical protein VC81_00410 [Levilactobacillus spicheri]
MDLPIAQDYLLLTEKITTRPMLRTRFTTQAYLVLATFLDLRAQHLLTVTEQRLAVPNSDRLQAALPAKLQLLATRLQDQLKTGDSTEAGFKLLVSWDLANAIYDTVGPELAQRHQVETVIFQNNLLPHTIYEPTPAAKQAVLTRLTQQITDRNLPATSLAVLTIFEQLNALKWLFPAPVADQIQQLLPTQPGYAELHGLTTLAQHRITMRKFELDSWLS